VYEVQFKLHDINVYYAFKYQRCMEMQLFSYPTLHIFSPSGCHNSADHGEIQFFLKASHGSEDVNVDLLS
jgi:hypothetical protein